jgi:hypothetical protein
MRDSQTPHCSAADARAGSCTSDAQKPQTFSHVSCKVLCALGYISTMTLVDGLLTKNEKCSLPPWIFIELLNCYMEFVRNVAMCQSHIKAEFSIRFVTVLNEKQNFF